MESRSEVLFIGGRSGAGKSSAALALHALLVDREVKHCVVEGDFLDMAYPSPWEHRLDERNLAAIWSNYRALGYRRLIYTNTVSVLQASALAEAMGDHPNVHSVLLQASDDEVLARLSNRQDGIEVDRHVERSKAAASRLEEEVAPHVPRIDTTGRTSGEVASMLLDVITWD